MSWLTKSLVGLIRVYQVTLSPYIGQQCRFAPTCSHYAIAALQKHGFFYGVYYAVRRLLKCHPWHAGGHDPIP